MFRLNFEKSSFILKTEFVRVSPSCSFSKSHDKIETKLNLQSKQLKTK